MAKATKTKSGRWRCKAYYTDIHGKYTNKSFTADTKKEAEYQALEFKMQLKRKKKPENVVLGELVDRYIENRTNILSPSTIAGYRKIRKNAFPLVMDTRAGFITTQMYQTAINDYAQGRSPKTISEAHRLVLRVMKANGIDIDEEEILIPQMIKTEIEVPTTEEVKLMLEKAEEKGIFLQVALAARMGLRKSEIFALTWGDIDTKKNTININKAKVKDEFGMYVVKPPKTKYSNRELSMPKMIIEALPPRDNNNEEVFKISVDASDSRYKRLMAKLNLKYRFHALRHYYASILLQEGVPNKYAMEMMGHATDNMLKKVYQHTFKEARKEFDNKIEHYFEKSGL